MRQTQKQVFQKAVEQFSGNPYRRAILKSFNRDTYTANVLLISSTSTLLENVPIDRSIPSRVLLINSKCLIMLLDPNNPQDSVLISVYSGRGGIPSVGIGYASGHAFSPTISYTSTAFTSVNKTRVKIPTGPGRVKLTVHGTNWTDTASGSGTFRIKCTLVDTAGVTTVQYVPHATDEVIMWEHFQNTASQHESFSFGWVVDVPEGIHTFEIQVARQSAVAAAINFDINDRLILIAEEL